MKKILVVLSLLFILTLLFNFILNNYYSTLYGSQYEVTSPAYMYWYPNLNLDNVSYYLLEKNTNVYCSAMSENKDFYLCAWKFSFSKEPLFGWVQIKDLKIHD